MTIAMSTSSRADTDSVLAGEIWRYLNVYINQYYCSDWRFCDLLI